MSYINTHKTNENVVRIRVFVSFSVFVLLLFRLCFLFLLFLSAKQKNKNNNNTRSTVAHSWVFIYSCLLFAAVLLYSFYKAKTTTATKADCLWVWALFVASPYRIFCVSPESEGACGRVEHTRRQGKANLNSAHSVDCQTLKRNVTYTQRVVRKTS